MAQLDAITGGVMKRRPALTRRNELEAQAPYIPSMIRAREDREYNDKVLAETQRQNEIQNQQWMQNYEAGKDAEDRSNKFRLAELGIAGVGALNEATDNGVVDMGKKALDYVIPDMGSVLPGTDFGFDASLDSKQMTAGSDSWLDNILGGVTKTASAITPDPIENVVKKAFDPATWMGEDSIWSDVSGFVDDLIDFDFDIPGF